MKSCCILMILYSSCTIPKFPACSPAETCLIKLATSRLSNAFTESTKRDYATLFSTFLAFTVFMGWNVNQVNVFHLLCFMECLYYNGVKHSQMANYLSAIKSKFIIFGLDVACFSDHRLKYYQKAVQLHAPFHVKLNKIIDVTLLKKIVSQCDLTYMGQIFKGLYLLSFSRSYDYRILCHIHVMVFPHSNI